MRRALTMLTIGMALALPSCGAPALAQDPPRPVPGEGPNCSPVHELKADALVTRILQDNDGDWWATVRFTSTGRTLIGYLSRATGKFCLTGEGRTQPEA